MYRQMNRLVRGKPFRAVRCTHSRMSRGRDLLQEKRSETGRSSSGEKGYVGLVPAMVRSGDVVVLIAGLAVPMILRRLPRSSPKIVTSI